MKIKVVNFLKKNKIVVIAILLVVLIILFIANKREEDPIVNTPLATQQGQNTNTLFIVSKNPGTNTFSSPWSVEPIKFTFNKEVKPETLVYSLNPSIETKILFEYTAPNEVSIIPLYGWIANQQYTLTITGLEASTGERITEPVQTTFTRTVNLQDLPEISE